MIEQTETRTKLAAITSDRWHVVHSQWSTTPNVQPFQRCIVSEHDDRSHAVEAARALALSLRGNADARPAEEHDQVFVRRPNFKSLAFARRRQRKRNGKD